MKSGTSPLRMRRVNRAEWESCSDGAADGGAEKRLMNSSSEETEKTFSAWEPRRRACLGDGIMNRMAKSRGER